MPQTEPVILFIQLVVLTAQVAGMWKIFSKAEQEGWKSIVPVYNIYVLIIVSENDWLYLPLLIVPAVNIYIWFKINIDIAYKFGQNRNWGILMSIFSFIYYPLLGFGEYSYKGGNPPQV